MLIRLSIPLRLSLSHKALVFSSLPHLFFHTLCRPVFLFLVYRVLSLLILNTLSQALELFLPKPLRLCVLFFLIIKLSLPPVLLLFILFPHQHHLDNLLDIILKIAVSLHRITSGVH
jgi:hypothetical protein